MTVIYETECVVSDAKVHLDDITGDEHEPGLTITITDPTTDLEGATSALLDTVSARSLALHLNAWANRQDRAFTVVQKIDGEDAWLGPDHCYHSTPQRMTRSEANEVAEQAKPKHRHRPDRFGMPVVRRTGGAS